MKSSLKIQWFLICETLYNIVHDDFPLFHMLRARLLSTSVPISLYSHVRAHINVFVLYMCSPCKARIHVVILSDVSYINTSSCTNIYLLQTHFWKNTTLPTQIKCIISFYFHLKPRCVLSGEFLAQQYYIKW